jgi:hypothetical protein
MKIFFLLICSAFSAIGFSQLSLQGKVLDNAGNPLVLATIQLVQNGSTIRYTSSGKNGEFVISADGLTGEKFTIRVSHISHQTDSVIINKAAGYQPLIITLFGKKEALREVIIQSKTAAARVSGDTLIYNLKAFTTGNEEKLKDILKKLPGIEINEEGKITSQGKVINSLLINGKEMFGDNHQIATENINAAMVGGIDLLGNYETFGAVKEIEGSNKTALNVKIKKEYLGKITGNAELLGAYDERYKLHSNLFKFTTKLNVSAIADLNNTGYQPLTSKDYFSMNRSVRQEMRNNNASLSSIASADDVPAFLLADDNVSSKKSTFASFDIACQPGKKVQLNGFSIFNRLKTTENLLSSRLLLDVNQNVSINESMNRNNGLFYNQTKFNIDYKPSANTLWNYTLLFDANTATSDNNIVNNLNDSSNMVASNLDKMNLSLGHQFSIIRKIARAKLLSINVFHEVKNQNTDLNLQSNIDLFSIGDRYVQANRIRRNDLGLYAKYTQKIGNHIVRAGSGLVYENSTFSTANPADPDGSASLTVQYAFLDLSVQKKTGKLHYQVKTELRPYSLQDKTDTRSQWVILPSLQLKYNFSQTHHLLASYNRTVDFPRIDRLNNFSYAEDFRTFTLRSPVALNTLLQQDIMAINYFKFDLYNGIVLMFNSAYIKYGNKLATNTSRKNTYNEVMPIVTNNQYSWSNTINYEHRISKIKNKFRIGASYIQSNFLNQVNGLNNRQNAVFYNIKTSLLSNFKEKYFNYEIGFSYISQQTTSGLFNQRNFVRRVTPSISFDGTIAEKWFYRIDNSYENFKSESVSTRFYNLGVKFRYRPKKVGFWLEGNNLLNINNPQVIKVSASNNILSTEIVNRLSGYIGFGIGFEI